jgi:hypothetical protein
MHKQKPRIWKMKTDMAKGFRFLPGARFGRGIQAATVVSFGDMLKADRNAPSMTGRNGAPCTIDEYTFETSINWDAYAYQASAREIAEYSDLARAILTAAGATAEDLERLADDIDDDMRRALADCETQAGEADMIDQIRAHLEAVAYEAPAGIRWTWCDYKTDAPCEWCDATAVAFFVVGRRDARALLKDHGDRTRYYHVQDISDVLDMVITEDVLPRAGSLGPDWSRWSADCYVSREAFAEHFPECSETLAAIERAKHAGQSVTGAPVMDY